MNKTNEKLDLSKKQDLLLKKVWRNWAFSAWENKNKNNE